MVTMWESSQAVIFCLSCSVASCGVSFPIKLEEDRSCCGAHSLVHVLDYVLDSLDICGGHVWLDSCLGF